MYIENLKIAAYSGSGVGKTVGIGSLIKLVGAENVGIISAERGLNTIASLVDPAGVRVCDDLKQFASAMEWAVECYTDPSQWVCVDGGSRVLQWVEQDTWGRAESCLRERLEGTTRSADPEYAVYITRDNLLDTRRIWSKVVARSERLFNRFVKLPSSTYWTFWETQPWLDGVQPPTKGVTWNIDAPGGGTRQAAQSTMDFVFRLTRNREGSLVARFANDPISYGKRRDDWNAGVKVPDDIVGFDLAEFVERVRGKGWAR